MQILSNLSKITRGIKISDVIKLFFIFKNNNKQNFVLLFHLSNLFNSLYNILISYNSFIYGSSKSFFIVKIIIIINLEFI